MVTTNPSTPTVPFPLIGELATRLLDCPVMATPASRDTVITLLGDLSKGLARHPKPNVEAVNLINVLLTFERGLEELAKILDYYDGKTIQFQAFKSVMTRVLDISSPQPMPRLAVARLQAMVTAIEPTETVGRLCVGALEPTAREPCELPLVACTVARLAPLAWSSDGSHPLLNFVAGLSPLITSVALRAQVEAWLAEQQQVHPGVPIFAIAAAPAAPLYLLVDLEPKIASERRYEIRAWLCNGHDCSISDEPTYVNDTGVTLAKMPTELGKILSTIGLQLEAARNKLTIEFILPDQLLSKEVDHWDTVDDRDPIGTRFSVVVRPRRRLSDQSRRAVWAGQWESMQLELANPASKLAVWGCPSDDENHHSLQVELKKGCRILSLPFPPRARANSDKGVLTALLKAGTVGAIWLRHPLPNLEDGRQVIENQVLGEAIKCLPEHVYTLRLEGWKHDPTGRDPQYWQNHLTLLWDDYNRRPPDLLPARGPIGS
jgi:hypothetical protein